MKKILLLALIFSLLLPCLTVPAAAASGEITVYNWGQNISDGSDDCLDVIAEFEKQTSIKVNYLTFDSNESVYAMASIGSIDFDVIIPSDYMVGKMISEGLLAKINYDNVPNFSLIDPIYTGWDFDPKSEYSVPYMWGITGIFYNKK